MTKKLLSGVSIKYKLIISFFLLTLIPFILIQYVYQHTSTNIIREKSIKYSQDLLKTLEFRLDVHFTKIIKQSELLLYDQKVYNFLALDSLNVFSSNDGVDIENIKTFREVNELLRDVTVSNPEILSTCIITPSGKIYSFESNSLRSDMTKLIKYDEMIKLARQANGKPVWYLIEESNGVNNIIMLRIIRSKDSFEEIGMVGILINKSELTSILQSIDFEMMNNIELKSSDDKIISTNQKDNKYFPPVLKGDLEKPKGYYIDSKSQTLVSYISLKSTNWKVLTYTPLSELYKEINKLRSIFNFLCLITILIAFFVSLFLSIDILQPINQLVRGMKSFQESGQNVEIAIDRTDELGYMGKTFNIMTKKINKLVNDIYIEQITRKEAEIKSLQSQINPHFLFNTLESINWMAQLNGVPEISETVTSLSSLMEVNICRNNKMVLLSEELKYIDNYVYIMKKRYEDRLEIVKDVDEELLDFKLPGLLIQPLVENSIYHGVEKSCRKILVTIRISKYENSSIIIEVMDNGAGIDPDELKKLNDKFKATGINYDQNNTGRKGIGLENVNRRIKLFYGEEYGLILESTPDEFTKVRVILPRRSDNELV